jgi:hypothetical protein
MIFTFGTIRSFTCCRVAMIASPAFIWSNIQVVVVMMMTENGCNITKKVHNKLVDLCIGMV